MHVGSGGASTKRNGAALSESTSGLRNLGADSGGVGGNQVGLADASLETVAGEGPLNGPMIPSMSLLRRGLKLLLGAACLRRSAGRVVITVEDKEPEVGVVPWVVALITVLGVVLVCLSLTVGGCCRVVTPEGPRIHSMRASEDSSEEDDRDQWSVISSDEGLEARGSPQAQGLRRRSLGARSSADPAPEFPKQYPNPAEAAPPSRGTTLGQGIRRNPQGPVNNPNPDPIDPRTYHVIGDENSQARGSPQAQGSSRSPQGPITHPHPDPHDPRYLEPYPLSETSRVSTAGVEQLLGGATRERGLGRTVPRSPGIVEIWGDGEVVGYLATHADDQMYVGLPSAAPQLAEGDAGHERPELDPDETWKGTRRLKTM